MKIGKKMIMKIIISAAVIIAAGVAAYFLMAPLSATAAASGAPKEAGQTLFEARKGSLAVKVEGPAVVEPVRSQVIRTRIEGQVVQAPLAGNAYAEGAVIVRFDRVDQEKIFRQAELALAQARLNRDRATDTMRRAEKDLADKQKLLAAGAIPKDQVDAAQDSLTAADYSLKTSDLSINQAVLGLDTARINLDATVLRAPFAGVVLNSAVTAGDLVTRNAILFTIADMTRIVLAAEVDEFDIGKLAPGQPVSVSSDTLGDRTLPSTVERVNPSAEVVNNISIFKVYATLDNKDGRLKPGMSADVSILISSSAGLVIPSKAVSSVRGRSYVKVSENGEIVSKRVTTGADNGQSVVVLEGLAEGEKVVLPGAVPAAAAPVAAPAGGASVIPITVPGAGGSR